MSALLKLSLEEMEPFFSSRNSKGLALGGLKMLGILGL